MLKWTPSIRSMLPCQMRARALLIRGKGLSHQALDVPYACRDMLAWWQPLAAVFAQQHRLTETLQGYVKMLGLEEWVLTVQVPIVCDLRALHHVRRSTQPAAIPGGRQFEIYNCPSCLPCSVADPASLPINIVHYTLCCTPCSCSPSSNCCKTEGSLKARAISIILCLAKNPADVMADSLQVVYGCANDRFGGCSSILSIHQTGCGGCGGCARAAHLSCCSAL